MLQMALLIVSRLFISKDCDASFTNSRFIVYCQPLVLPPRARPPTTAVHWLHGRAVYVSTTVSSNRPTGPIQSSSRDVRVLFVCLSPIHVLDFEAYFAPTSQSRMSKIFRDFEILGKNAEKKWSQN